MSISFGEVCPAADQTPFQRYAQAKALDDGLESVLYEWEWVMSSQAGTATSNTRVALVCENREAAEKEEVLHIRTDDGSSHPKESSKTLWYKDGYRYISNDADHAAGKKAKADPPSASAFSELEEFGFLRFEKQYVVSQTAAGNTLRFGIDPKRQNADFQKMGATLRKQDATVEVELNGDGTVKRVVGEGSYYRTDAPDNVTRYKCTLTILQRNGVTIDFPPGLEAYPEG